jgi:hypothetical protein
MNVNKMIAELKAELAAVNEALILMDRIARAQGKRRGRPPLYLLKSPETVAAPRRPFRESSRRKMAAGQKRRWAAYRKAQKAQKVPKESKPGEQKPRG